MVVEALLCGCASEKPAEKLQRQYDMMERAGASDDVLCAQSNKIEQAFLEAGEEKDYKLQKLMARQTCLNAALGHRLKR